MLGKELKCPSCHAQMTLEFVAPGDKVAKCPYCGTIVDLSEGAGGAWPGLEEGLPGAAHGKTTEVEEEEVGRGYRVRRVVRVTEHTAVSEELDGDAGRLLEEARQLLAGSGRARSATSLSSARTTREEVVTTTSSPGPLDPGILPDEVKELLSEMHGPLSRVDPQESPPGAAGQEPPGRTGTRPVPASNKGSWWSRLFGKRKK